MTESFTWLKIGKEKIEEELLMEFERIGKNTVQCHMTAEEMDEYGLRIEDFFTNQEKSRNFLEHLVERAEEEIGYEVESGMISMQLMRMPDDSLTITFSDKGEDGIQNMLSQIQNLAGMIDEHTAATITDADAMHQVESMQEFAEGAPQQTDTSERKKKQKVQQKKQQTAARVFAFERLEPLESFVQTLPYQKPVSSKLYHDAEQGVWYLVLKKGKLKLEEYQGVCRRLSEYGTLCNGHPFMEQYCREHFDCVIGKQALHTMKEYVS